MVVGRDLLGLHPSLPLTQWDSHQQLWLCLAEVDSCDCKAASRKKPGGGKQA